MAFDVFGLRDHVVREYRDYVESFIHVRDRRIESFVNEMLERGKLWPDAVLQLNPAYETAGTLADLAAEGVIGKDTARFFGPAIRLYKHQAEAIAAAKAGEHGEPYIVSTGTGSGKSLTYLVPIVDHVLRNNPADHSVRAIIVYPMNALINSQLAALEAFKRNWPDCPLTFARYTGQDREEARRRILTDPPHILLTNYVMLEYMLIRPAERPLIHQATRALKFLAVDELHVYRGRQGADVAQEHYLCSLAPGKEGKELLPRSPLLHVTDDDLPGTPGFVSLEDGSLWNEAEDLPDNFVEVRKGGPRIKAHYAAHVPQRIWVTADGKTSRTKTDGALAAWWQPRPLLLCLRCRAAYDLRESDFRKLVTLSQTGRSTATTVIGTTVVTGLPEFGSRESGEPNRLLSFTDNRQDASLQAGHTNDFVQVVQLGAE